jgi:hypothetical protein
LNNTAQETGHTAALVYRFILFIHDLFLRIYPGEKKMNPAQPD